MKSLVLIVFCTLVTSCAIMDNLKIRGNRNIHKIVNDSIYYEYGEYISTCKSEKAQIKYVQFRAFPQVID